MKRSIFMLVAALFAVCFVFTSCKDDNEPATIAKVEYGLTLNVPLDVEGGSLQNATAVFTNVLDKTTYTLSNFKEKDGKYNAVFSIPEGTYNIEVKGSLTYKVNNQSLTSEVRATKSNVKVAKSAVEGIPSSTEIALNTYNTADGLVISEIYFSFSKTPEGKDYSDDQYIKIANNSDTLMYADGLAIVQSQFQTNVKNDYKPNVMPQGMTVEDIFVIPGTGKQYPIKPGEEIVIAFNARNHKEFNPNSIDLSKANFQFYSSMFIEGVDANGEETETEKQNNNVPVLKHVYGDPDGRVTPNRNGVKAYALVRIEGDVETFKKNYEYKVKYVEAEDPYNLENEENYLMVPNKWVIDAVNLAVKSDHQWNVVAPSLDAGFTYWAEQMNDASSYRKAVLRKKNGTKWIDTNNSTNDFEAAAKPSYFEY